MVYDPISGRAELNPPVPVYGPRALKSPGTTRTRANLMAYDADGALLSTTALYSDGPIAPDPVVGDDYGGPSQLFALVRCDPDDVARIDFSIDGHVRSWTATAHAPALTGLRAAVRDGRLRLGWRSADPDGDRVEHTVLLSADAGRTWTPIAYRLRDDQGTDFPLWALPPGDLVFEVVASDGIRYAAERVTVRDVPGTQIHSSR